MAESRSITVFLPTFGQILFFTVATSAQGLICPLSITPCEVSGFRGLISWIFHFSLALEIELTSQRHPNFIPLVDPLILLAPLKTFDLSLYLNNQVVNLIS